MLSKNLIKNERTNNPFLPMNLMANFLFKVATVNKREFFKERG